MKKKLTKITSLILVLSLLLSSSASLFLVYGKCDPDDTGCKLKKQAKKSCSSADDVEACREGKKQAQTELNNIQAQKQAGMVTTPTEITDPEKAGDLAWNACKEGGGSDADCRSRAETAYLEVEKDHPVDAATKEAHIIRDTLRKTALETAGGSEALTAEQAERIRRESDIASTPALKKEYLNDFNQEVVNKYGQDVTDEEIKQFYYGEYYQQNRDRYALPVTAESDLAGLGKDLLNRASVSEYLAQQLGPEPEPVMTEEERQEKLRKGAEELVQQGCQEGELTFELTGEGYSNYSGHYRCRDGKKITAQEASQLKNQKRLLGIKEGQLAALEKKNQDYTPYTPVTQVDIQRTGEFLADLSLALNSTPEERGIANLPEDLQKQITGAQNLFYSGFISRLEATDRINSLLKDYQRDKLALGFGTVDEYETQIEALTMATEIAGGLPSRMNLETANYLTDEMKLQTLSSGDGDEIPDVYEQFGAQVGYNFDPHVSNPKPAYARTNPEYNLFFDAAQRAGVYNPETGWKDPSTLTVEDTKEFQRQLYYVRNPFRILDVGIPTIPVFGAGIPMASLTRARWADEDLDEVWGPYRLYDEPDAATLLRFAQLENDWQALVEVAGKHGIDLSGIDREKMEAYLEAAYPNANPRIPNSRLGIGDLTKQGNLQASGLSRAEVTQLSAAEDQLMAYFQEIEKSQEYANADTTHVNFAKDVAIYAATDLVLGELLPGGAKKAFSSVKDFFVSRLTQEVGQEALEPFEVLLRGGEQTPFEVLLGEGNAEPFSVLTKEAQADPFEVLRVGGVAEPFEVVIPVDSTAGRVAAAMAEEGGESLPQKVASQINDFRDQGLRAFDNLKKNLSGVLGIGEREELDVVVGRLEADPRVSRNIETAQYIFGTQKGNSISPTQLAEAINSIDELADDPAARALIAQRGLTEAGLYSNLYSFFDPELGKSNLALEYGGEVLRFTQGGGVESTTLNKIGQISLTPQAYYQVNNMVRDVREALDSAREKAVNFVSENLNLRGVAPERLTTEPVEEMADLSALNKIYDEGLVGRNLPAELPKLAEPTLVGPGNILNETPTKILWTDIDVPFKYLDEESERTITFRISDLLLEEDFNKTYDEWQSIFDGRVMDGEITSGTRDAFLNNLLEIHNNLNSGPEGIMLRQHQLDLDIFARDYTEQTVRKLGQEAGLSETEIATKIDLVRHNPIHQMTIEELERVYGGPLGNTEAFVKFQQAYLQTSRGSAAIRDTAWRTHELGHIVAGDVSGFTPYHFVNFSPGERQLGETLVDYYLGGYLDGMPVEYLNYLRANGDFLNATIRTLQEKGLEPIEINKLLVRLTLTEDISELRRLMPQSEMDELYLLYGGSDKVKEAIQATLPIQPVSLPQRLIQQVRDAVNNVRGSVQKIIPGQGQPVGIIYQPRLPEPIENLGLSIGDRVKLPERIQPVIEKIPGVNRLLGTKATLIRQIDETMSVAGFDDAVRKLVSEGDDPRQAYLATLHQFTDGHSTSMLNRLPAEEALSVVDEAIEEQPFLKVDPGYYGRPNNVRITQGILDDWDTYSATLQIRKGDDFIRNVELEADGLFQRLVESEGRVNHYTSYFDKTFLLHHSASMYEFDPLNPEVEKTLLKSFIASDHLIRPSYKKALPSILEQTNLGIDALNQFCEEFGSGSPFRHITFEDVLMRPAHLEGSNTAAYYVKELDAFAINYDMMTYLPDETAATLFHEAAHRAQKKGLALLEENIADPELRKVIKEGGAIWVETQGIVRSGINVDLNQDWELLVPSYQRYNDIFYNDLQTALKDPNMLNLSNEEAWRLMNLAATGDYLPLVNALGRGNEEKGWEALKMILSKEPMMVIEAYLPAPQLSFSQRAIQKINTLPGFKQLSERNLAGQQIVQEVEQELKDLGVNYQKVKIGGHMVTQREQVLTDISSLSELEVQFPDSPGLAAHELTHVRQIQELLDQGIPTSIMDQDPTPYDIEAYKEGLKVALRYGGIRDIYIQTFGLVLSEMRIIKFISIMERGGKQLFNNVTERLRTRSLVISVYAAESENIPVNSLIYKKVAMVEELAPMIEANPDLTLEEALTVMDQYETIEPKLEKEGETVKISTGEGGYAQYEIPSGFYQLKVDSLQGYDISLPAKGINLRNKENAVLEIGIREGGGSVTTVSSEETGSQSRFGQLLQGLRALLPSLISLAYAEPSEASEGAVLGQKGFGELLEEIQTGEAVENEGVITLLLYHDTNGNGVRESGENALPWAGVTITLSKETESVAYQLLEGWNFVSFPVVPQSFGTASELITDAARQGAYITSVGRWDGAQWQEYIQRGEEAYGQDFPIEPGVAYMLRNHVHLKTWVVSGFKISSSVPLQLKTGFNGVGIPYSEKEQTAATVLDGINLVKSKTLTPEAENANLISRFVSGNWDVFIKRIYSEDNLQEYGNNFKILPTEGYFIRVKREVDWTP